jgi:FkbM family methyltransferase
MARGTPRSILAALRARLRRRPPIVREPRATSYRGEDGLVLQCCIAYNDHGGYCVPRSSHHRPAAQRVLSGGVWEPDTLALMAGRAGAGDIVHAGTYFGDFIPALSRACADGARVWAFEPNPENYRCARITAEINGVRNVAIRNAGLGARAGAALLRVADDGGRALGGASHVVPNARKEDPGDLVEVDVVALDEVLPPDRQVAVVQLDVEGFEQPALTGAIETIRRCHPVLILERLPEPGWLAEHILSLGYRVAGTVHRNTVLTM